MFPAYLIEKEVRFLGEDAGKNPERPFLAIMGGAKVGDKIPVIENLLKKVDSLIIAGGMSYTFFKAMGYEIGTSILDEESIGLAGEIMEKAKAANVPNENIERIIKKAAGEGDDSKYENITYEGYGPSGIAVIVETLTDNRNRTAGDVRHYFDKFGGNLGTSGCVSFMFSQKGVLVIEREGLEEDKVMEDCLEAGAADFQADEDVFEIYTEPDDFSGVLDDLTQKGYEFVSAEVEMVPSTYTTLTDEDAITKMRRLLDALEDNDDVQNVWHNWENADEDDEE